MAVNEVEIWVDIPEYEGLYEVSSLGRIRKGERIKKLNVDHKGYLCVWLSKRSQMKCFKVHRLVASAFISNPQNKKTVNHKDGNKQNNGVANLEWATHSENIIHALKTGLRVVTEAQREAARRTGRITCEQNRPRKAVYCCKDGVKVTFKSAHEGARFVEGNASAVVRCCKGKAKRYKGYEWGYSNG